MSRAADGLRWDRMCVSAAPEAAVNDADASATRTALGIVYSRYRSTQCARWSDDARTAIGNPETSDRSLDDPNLADRCLLVKGHRASRQSPIARAGVRGRARV